MLKTKERVSFSQKGVEKATVQFLCLATFFVSQIMNFLIICQT